MFPSVEEQMLHLRRGVAEIISETELEAKLRTSKESRSALVVKLGCDPSRPDLHLGHAVVLRKLRQFQDLGHRAVLIIGDFTGMIGDASGRNKARPPLTLEETRANGRSYFEQASRILNPDTVEIVYNSSWLEKMNFRQVVQLAGTFTVAKMLAREDFAGRLDRDDPIGLHELLYPLAQAQDSVVTQSDVELGGTDQKFNLLVGRSLQRHHGQPSQVCMLLPILEGLDGREKMSKSLNNYVGICEEPNEMYGKIMSLPDALIYRYFELATDADTRELPRLKAYAEEDPRNAKHDLAHSVVRMYHGPAEAHSARSNFERTVIRGGVPENVRDYRPEAPDGTIGVLSLLTQAGLTASNGEARRLIEQRGVAIDGSKVEDVRLVLDLPARAPFVIQVGKRKFARIVY